MKETNNDYPKTIINLVTVLSST